MTVFAVDVNKSDLRNLEMCLKNVYPEAKVISHIGMHTEQILREVRLAQPDYFIAEAVLGNGDGVALANLVKQKNPTVRIFITNNSNAYGVEAWNIHAQGYLLKPITEDKIREYL